MLEIELVDMMVGDDVRPETIARAVFEILKETPRPYLYPEQKLISYKTGTAYEFTDALAIGSLNNLTVAVSISSPYNIKGNTHYTGYDSASPYLFEILSKSKTEKLYKEDLNSPLLNTAPPTALTELNLTNQSHALNHEKKLEITFPTNGQTQSVPTARKQSMVHRKDSKCSTR